LLNYTLFSLLCLSLPVRSDSIVGITVGLLDPKNIGLAVGIALLSCVQLEFRHEEVVTLYLLMKMAHHPTFHL